MTFKLVSCFPCPECILSSANGIAGDDKNKFNIGNSQQQAICTFSTKTIRYTKQQIGLLAAGHFHLIPASGVVLSCLGTLTLNQMNLVFFNIPRAPFPPTKRNHWQP